MNEQLQAAAAEATTDKADAWEKFTAACQAWCRDVLHGPEEHRALADAACEFAETLGRPALSPEESQAYLTWLEHGTADEVRAEAVAKEREAIIALVNRERMQDDSTNDYDRGCNDTCDDVIAAIHARGRKASEAPLSGNAELRAEVARLREGIERQKGALRMFERANKTIAMARAPAELKEAANAARRNEAGVQEANAVLTDEVERLTERNAGLAAALREAKKLGTHRIAAGDNYACDVADIADEALEKFTGEKP